MRRMRLLSLGSIAWCTAWESAQGNFDATVAASLSFVWCFHYFQEYFRAEGRDS